MSYLGVQQSCVIIVIQNSTNSDIYLLQSVGFEAFTRSICNNYASATISLYLRRTQKTHFTSFQVNPIRLPTMYPYNVPRPPLAVICHFEIDNCIISTYYYILRRICTESNFPGINRINPSSSA